MLNNITLFVKDDNENIIISESQQLIEKIENLKMDDNDDDYCDITKHFNNVNLNEFQEINEYHELITVIDYNNDLYFHMGNEYSSSLIGKVIKIEYANINFKQFKRIYTLGYTKTTDGYLVYIHMLI